MTGSTGSPTGTAAGPIWSSTPSADVLARSAAVVAPGGTLVSISAPPGVLHRRPDRAQPAELADRVRSGRLRPLAGVTFPLGEARQAFLAKRDGMPGKVVVVRA